MLGPTTPLSFLLVDPSPMVRDGVEALIHMRFDATTHKVGSVAEALRPTSQPIDLVLTEINFPGALEQDVVSELMLRSDAPRVVVLTERSRPDEVHQALDRGACGYLLKSATVDELHRAIELIAAGARYLQAEVGADVLTRRARSSAEAAGLTPAESRLLLLLARGYTNRQSAVHENVSLRTIEGRRANVQAKLGCRGRAELTRRAQEIGIFDSS